MSKNGQPDKLASEIAEEVLRTIYGDDFIGCRVTPDQIAAVISEGLKAERAPTQELLELYEKVVEAVHLLSTPPENQSVADPNELRTLLGERLDSIHAVTTKTMKTTAAAKRKSDL
jgi:YesN/AraC family two-component response regulator